MTPTLNKIVKRIYEVTESKRKGRFSDESWENVNDVFHAIDMVINAANAQAGSQVFYSSFESAGYKQSNDGTAHWKEYRFTLNDRKRNQSRVGVLNCCAAGTIENPFEKYDMVLMF